MDPLRERRWIRGKIGPEPAEQQGSELESADLDKYASRDILYEDRICVQGLVIVIIS